MLYSAVGSRQSVAGSPVLDRSFDCLDNINVRKSGQKIMHVHGMFLVGLEALKRGVC